MVESTELKKRRIELKEAKRALKKAQKEKPIDTHSRLRKEVEYRIVRVFNQWQLEQDR